jgi:hypothetical protein
MKSKKKTIITISRNHKLKKNIKIYLLFGLAYVISLYLIIKILL